MEEYKKIKYITISVIIILLTTSCINKPSDSNRFKQEYEKYNKTKIKLNIPKNNIIKYKTNKEINKILKKTGVIFIGSPKDNLSRVAIKYLIEASDTTDLKQIYYINTTKKINKIENKIPQVIFVLKGKIISTHIGTINNKTKLTEGEELELYNIYSEKIHEVLQDTCDEEC